MADDTDKLLKLLEELETRARTNAYSMFDCDELNTLLTLSGRINEKRYAAPWYIAADTVLKLVPEARLRLQLIARPDNYRNVVLFRRQKKRA